MGFPSIFLLIFSTFVHFLVSPFIHFFSILLFFISHAIRRQNYGWVEWVPSGYPPSPLFTSTGEGNLFSSSRFNRASEVRFGNEIAERSELNALWEESKSNISFYFSTFLPFHRFMFHPCREKEKKYIKLGSFVFKNMRYWWNSALKLFRMEILNVQSDGVVVCSTQRNAAAFFQN